MSADQQKKYLLIVENDPINLDVIIRFLQQDYEIDSALSGLEAIEKAKSKSYDAILMDINLGRGMNGLEAVQTIKKINGYENTPVVAVTAYAMRNEEEEFLNNGCTHYLSKPFSKLELNSLVASLFVPKSVGDII